MMNFKSSPAGLLLDRLTSDDVTKMLTEKGYDKKDINAKGRMAPFYLIRQKDVGFAVKFTDQKDAESHVLNTQLFEFFNMPIVPCVALPLKTNFDSAVFFQDMTKRNYTYLTHMVVMPIAPGKPFKEFADKNLGILKEEATHRLFGHVLEHGAAICLADHWDCTPRNIIVETDTKEAEPSGFDPDAFSFIDAEHGLLTKTSHGHTLCDDVSYAFATIATQYLYAFSAFASANKQNFYERTSKTCNLWRENIASASRITSYTQQTQLKEALIARADALQKRLKHDML